MRKYTWLSVLLLVAFLVAACGGGATPATQAPAAPAQPTTAPAAPAQPTTAPLPRSADDSPGGLGGRESETGHRELAQ